MVLREYILCAGCAAKTELKVQVGSDELQNFYFICEKCDAVANGVLKVDFKASPPKIHLRIEDSEATKAFEGNPDQTIIVSTDFPCPIRRGRVTDFSAFLENVKLTGHGEKIAEYGKRLGMFRSFMASDWNKLKRLLTYYVKRNWALFDKEWAVIYPNEYVPKNDFERHDFIHRTLEMFFIPLLPEPASESLFL